MLVRLGNCWLDADLVYYIELNGNSMDIKIARPNPNVIDETVTLTLENYTEADHIVDKINKARSK